MLDLGPQFQGLWFDLSHFWPDRPLYRVAHNNCQGAGDRGLEGTGYNGLLAVRPGPITFSFLFDFKSLPCVVGLKTRVESVNPLLFSVPFMIGMEGITLFL